MAAMRPALTARYDPARSFGSVTMLRVGATASIDTQTAQQPVIGFVPSNAGLMANLSLNGTRVNRLEL